MVWLDDLMAEGNFRTAVDLLATDCRTRHGLPAVHQLGLVVPDVEAAAARLEQQGIGTFFIATGSPVYWRENGTRPAVSGKLGMAYHHGIELELLEPTVGSDFYRRSLDPDGRIVVQHLGFLVDDVDGWVERATRNGMPVQVRGRLRAWPTTTDFAYMETDEQSGLIMEFISWRLLGLPIHPPAGMFRTIGRLEKWSGKRSIAI